MYDADRLGAPGGGTVSAYLLGVVHLNLLSSVGMEPLNTLGWL